MDKLILAKLPGVWDDIIIKILIQTKKKKKENKLSWILIFCVFVFMILACILVLITNVHTFDSVNWLPNPDSVCKTKCFTNSNISHLSSHHLNSISFFVGILYFVLALYQYPLKQYLPLKKNAIQKIDNKWKTITLRILAMLISFSPFLFVIIIKQYCKDWAYFVYCSIISFFFFIWFTVGYPFLLKSFKVDFPSDLFVNRFNGRLTWKDQLMIVLLCGRDVNLAGKAYSSRNNMYMVLPSIHEYIE